VLLVLFSSGLYCLVDYGLLALFSRIWYRRLIYSALLLVILLLLLVCLVYGYVWFRSIFCLVCLG
jgi:hypothetical protein